MNGKWYIKERLLLNLRKYGDGLENSHMLVNKRTVNMLTSPPPHPTSPLECTFVHF